MSPRQPESNLTDTRLPSPTVFRSSAMRITCPLLIAAAALSGGANGQYEEQVRAEAQKDLAQALDGYAATGKTSDCVNPRNVSGPQIIGNTTMLYSEPGTRTWSNAVIGS